MKNRDVILLINTGALNTTSLDLPAADAYKLIGFKRALRKQLDEIIARQNEIGDNEALRAELMNEDITLDCKVMSYESFHALEVENKAVQVSDKDGNAIGTFAPFAICEELLEGVFWQEPKE